MYCLEFGINECNPFLAHEKKYTNTAKKLHSYKQDWWSNMMMSTYELSGANCPGLYYFEETPKQGACYHS